MTTLRISGTEWRNPANLTQQRIEGAENTFIFQACPRRVGWRLSCTQDSEHSVFRVAVLSVVLTLAVGPNASLLCRTRCDQKAAAASGCHHEELTGSAIVAGDDGCDHVVLGVAVFLREDARRGVSAADAAHAIVVPRYQVAYSTIDGHPGHEPGREWSLEKRPLPTALRL